MRAEYRGAGRASGPKHQDFQIFDRDPLLQRTHHAGGIGVEPVQLAILSANKRVAGRCLVVCVLGEDRLCTAW